MLAKECLTNPTINYSIKGFLDDDAKKGVNINGVKYSINQLPEYKTY